MRVSGVRLLLGLGALLAGFAGPAAAQAVNKTEQAAVNRFAANNSLFVLYHEIGHLLVDQLDLPVLGKEEDAADNMATWMLLRRGTKAADQALADAAYGWLLSGLAYGSDIADEDLYANHSLDRQRAFQIVCLMVGSDAKTFRSIANDYAIDDDRQGSCAADYGLVNRSLNILVGGGARKIERPTEVTVVYHEVNGTLKQAADAFRASGVFDQVANELRSQYSLPRPIRFSAERCGEANAFYDPDIIEISFCYEMMQDFIDLYGTGTAKGAMPGTRQIPRLGKPKNKTKPQLRHYLY